MPKPLTQLMSYHFNIIADKGGVNHLSNIQRSAGSLAIPKAVLPVEGLSHISEIDKTVIWISQIQGHGRNKVRLEAG